ncbi:MAG TPA: HEAT repeat domain-containing protein [bacterium]|nr:HEAT repeat domain-containing protein [bacterium]
MRTTSAIFLMLLALLAALPSAAQTPESAEPDTVALAALTPEELFLRASSAALQFQHMIEPSRKIMVRDHERTLPYLVTQLDTDGVRERHALEDILVRIGAPAAASVIEGLLVEAGRSDTTRGARMAATVLGRIGEPSAVEPLASVHDHHDWKVRGAIGSALGRIGVAETVVPLVSMLADENEVVRKSAAVGLKRVAIRATDAEAPDPEAVDALDRDVIESLVGALGDVSYAVRYSSSDALARIGEPALPRLLEAVESSTGEARLMAMRAMGMVGSQEALKPLVRALEDPDWAVRAFAASAIGVIGPDDVAKRALERLVSRDEHPFVVSSAAVALAEVDG